jgi:hypothetical protein
MNDEVFKANSERVGHDYRSDHCGVDALAAVANGLWPVPSVRCFFTVEDGPLERGYNVCDRLLPRETAE